MRTRVKICGITKKKDALFASNLGVDALGFVFYKDSPRYIDPIDAGKIISCLHPFVLRVGLFVNNDAAFVRDSIIKSKINFLQFHGDESEEYCNQFNLPYIKAISMKEDINLLECCNYYKSASALLLDTFSKKLKGGTGTVFDWKKIPRNLGLRLIIAGGLNSENIISLIKTVKPFCVDVSGGVESSKGVKDEKKMKDFMIGVNDATL
ncbi:phosphoribosylanthranilate isomerase [Methylophilaceae bacterium]|nr:phosphoribosylanthranilate isomerase [Methylophilaceae bacterium]